MTARLLSRAALAFGWVTLAFIATAALAENPINCDTITVNSPCDAAGTMPPPCSFWIKGPTIIEDVFACKSKTTKTRQRGNYGFQNITTNPDAVTQLAAAE